MIVSSNFRAYTFTVKEYHFHTVLNNTVILRQNENWPELCYSMTVLTDFIMSISNIKIYDIQRNQYNLTSQGDH